MQRGGGREMTIYENTVSLKAVFTIIVVAAVQKWTSLEPTSSVSDTLDGDKVAGPTHSENSVAAGSHCCAHVAGRTGQSSQS
jgi:hypothetical protein